MARIPNRRVRKRRSSARLHPLSREYTVLRFGPSAFLFGPDREPSSEAEMRTLWQRYEPTLRATGEAVFDRRVFVAFWMLERGLDEEHAFEAASLVRRALQESGVADEDAIERQARKVVVTADPRDPRLDA